VRSRCPPEGAGLLSPEEVCHVCDVHIQRETAVASFPVRDTVPVTKMEICSLLNIFVTSFPFAVLSKDGGRVDKITQE
jgi:hypothetical protein